MNSKTTKQDPFNKKIKSKNKQKSQKESMKILNFYV
jgi:hypothetical protein